MGVIRNFIEIVGISEEGDLPQKSFGQLIKYSEVEQIIIPRDKSAIKDIYQVGIKVEVKSKRIINTGETKTVVLDGTKCYKIVCTQHENTDKVVMINLQQPYNTFFEVPCHINNFENIQIHILDAYFEVLEKRRIYGHFLYLVDVRYNLIDMGATSSKNEWKPDILILGNEDKDGETQIALSYEKSIIMETTRQSGYSEDEVAGEYL